jgi:hypothetical protein
MRAAKLEVSDDPALQVLPPSYLFRTQILVSNELSIGNVVATEPRPSQMNTVSVRLRYRPIRVGMCVAEYALEDLRRAVRLNSTLCGGKHNPIIPIGSDLKFAKTLAQTFRVDVLFAVSQTSEVTQFVDSMVHLPWPDSEQSLFSDDGEGPVPAFVDILHALRRLSKQRGIPEQTTKSWLPEPAAPHSGKARWQSTS